MRSKKRTIAVCTVCVLVLLLGMFAAKIMLNKFNSIFGRLDAMEQDLGSRMDLTSGELYRVWERTEGLWYAVAKTQAYDFDYSWVETVPPLVAHAFGGIDGYTYTNSREAFLHNYELGQRVFEVDLDLTRPENTVVASHDEGSWRIYTGADETMEYNYENFMSTPVEGKYTALDYRGVIDLMAEYPDVYFITDSKYQDRATVFLEFSQLVRYAEETDPTVLERLVPQIYHEDMLQWVMDVYPFKSIVYTLYASARTPEQIYDFCESTGVRMVTHRDELSRETIDMWSELGIIISVHTINDTARAEELMAQGVDLLYTDTLLPTDIK